MTNEAFEGIPWFKPDNVEYSLVQDHHGKVTIQETEKECPQCEKWAEEYNLCSAQRLRAREKVTALENELLEAITRWQKLGEWLDRKENQFSNYHVYGCEVLEKMKELEGEE